MSKKHRVFPSYHHVKGDENYKRIFDLRFGNKCGVVMPSGVKLGAINPGLPDETIRQKIRDEYLRNSSVTIVLVGPSTWQRRHVDWEISSSIRDTQLNPRSGLLGIVLPTYPGHSNNTYDPWTIPPRLHDNIECGYATLHPWTNDALTMQQWVHDAYLRKGRIRPTNARPLYRYNRSGQQWN